MFEIFKTTSRFVNSSDYEHKIQKSNLASFKFYQNFFSRYRRSIKNGQNFILPDRVEGIRNGKRRGEEKLIHSVSL